MLVKIHQIEYPNRWPYEKVVRTFTTDESQAIQLSAEADKPRMWRLHDPGLGRHVSWGVVEDFEREPPANAELHETWVQFEYSIFSSRDRGDDERLSALRDKVRANGLDAVAFPQALRPEKVSVGSADDAFHTLRLEGDVLRRPFNTLYISELSDLRPINDHTIPEEIDFAWVDVQVMVYGRIDSIPTYRELLERLGQYAECFRGLID